MLRATALRRTALPTSVRGMSTFSLPKETLDTINATLPAVADAGPAFTTAFYGNLFKAHPELLNVFNKTNQAAGLQSTKLFSSVALAATVALEDGDFPADALGTICHRHCALGVLPEQYDVVGEHLLQTISENLSDDPAVLDAWGQLYGQVAGAMIATEKGLADEAAAAPGGWSGKRQFVIEKKEQVSADVIRFAFTPADGGAVPDYTPGKYTTVWAHGDGWEHTQPRHYTLATPRDAGDRGKHLSISVKRTGLVSGFLHDAEVGAEVDLSAPFGCFNTMQNEEIWLKDSASPVVFLSGGIGITPVLAMLENLVDSQPVTWLHASENGDYHPYRNRLQLLASVRGGALQRRVWYSDPTEEDGTPVAGDNTANYHFAGRMDFGDLEKGELHLDNPATQYYMCGGPGWSAAVSEMLAAEGVSPAQVHAEGFGD